MNYWWAWFKSCFQKAKVPPPIRKMHFWAIMDRVSNEGWSENEGWTQVGDGLTIDGFESAEDAYRMLPVANRLCAEVVWCEADVEDV